MTDVDAMDYSDMPELEEAPMPAATQEVPEGPDFPWSLLESAVISRRFVYTKPTYSKLINDQWRRVQDLLINPGRISRVVEAVALLFSNPRTPEGLAIRIIATLNRDAVENLLASSEKVDTTDMPALVDSDDE